MPASASESQAGGRRLRPDRDLRRRILASGGEDLGKCMQCATCSAVCELADGRNPGPRKEMLWAQWGLRERLMGDGDLWLCHQCGDCTLRCPRGARPGDVMAALRRECIVHYATPRVFGRWANHPAGLLGAVMVAALVLVGAAAAWAWSAAAVAELSSLDPRAVLPFWTRLPHGLLASIFLSLVAFDGLVLVRGGRRFWRDLEAASAAWARPPTERRSGSPIRAALGRILWHDDFGACLNNQVRHTHHLLVVYGMLALWLTSLWVVTARWNPLLDGLVYPLSFWNPWKIMANAGGLAVALGSTLMLAERWRRPKTAGVGTYSDFALLGLLLVITLTGFAAELLHLVRIEPLRYFVYALHLISVFALLLMLPYSKLAHVVYRTLALVHAERIERGRR